jgi:hypothetical protein
VHALQAAVYAYAFRFFAHPSSPGS